MRVAIVGSREWKHPHKVREAVYSYVESLPPGTIIVSGGARGVDDWAYAAARHFGLQCIVCWPAWRTRNGVQDPQAGFDRNRTIESIADRVVAFWNGHSNGTRQCAGLFADHEKPVKFITPEGLP